MTMKISHDKYLISSIKIARERKKIENKSIIQTELETYQPIAIYLKSKFKQANFKKNDRKIWTFKSLMILKSLLIYL